MRKKSVASKETLALLKLIRIALGLEKRYYFGDLIEPFPTDINWNEVIQLSYVHKVSALAVYGLLSSGYNPSNELDEKNQSAEHKDSLINWINDISNAENCYSYYIDILSTLSQIFASKGLKTIVLKGVGLAVNYPSPSHRGVGDIDIFLVDQQNKPAGKIGDDIISNQFNIKVGRKEGENHSHFEFKGIRVENHYQITKEYFGLEYEHELINTLEDLILQNPVVSNISGNIFFPNPTFNTLFLMRHMFAHYSSASNNIRQYCDFVTFLRSWYQDVDWNTIKRCLDKFDMKDYANGMIGMLAEILNMNTVYCPIYEQNPSMTSVLKKDCLNPTARGTTFYSRIIFYYDNRFRYKHTTHKSWLIPMWNSIAFHINKILGYQSKSANIKL